MTKATNKKTVVAAKPAKGKGKPAANQPLTIAVVTSVRGGSGGVYVEASNGTSLQIADWQMNKQTVKLARKGGDYAELQTYLATLEKPAKLANGVDSRNSPHSAKAVADQKAKQPAAKGKAATKSAAKKQSSGGRGYDRAAKLAVLVKAKDSGLAEGSGRLAKLEFAAKCKTVGDFLGQVVTDATGKEHKCDAGALSGMLKRNHVKVG